MRLLLPPALATVLLVLAATSPAALAARGDGPYTPFPEEDPVGRALDFVTRLNSRSGAPSDLTPEQLAQGVVLQPRAASGGKRRTDPPAEDTGEAAPFKQAGVAQASDPPSPAGWPFALAAGVLAAGGLLVAARSAAGGARQRGGGRS